MEIDVISISQNPREQINEDIDVHLSSFVYNTVKTIVAEDRFNIFKLRSSSNIDLQLEQLNVQIDELVSTSSELKNELEDKETELNKIKTENDKFIEHVLGVL